MTRRHYVSRFTPLLVFALALLVYLFTLAPDLTWAHNGADGGDLIAASFTGGVAHPPGYPLYLMLGRLAALLPVGNVPYRYNLFSALAAAGAAAVTAWSGQRLAALADWRGALAGAGAGLALAFAPLVWEQAVITEVYGLNALLCAAVIALGANVPRRLDHVFALGTVYSLAVTHHLTLGCFLPLGVLRLAQAGKLIGWKRVAGVGAAGTLIGLTPLIYLPLAARAPVVWGEPAKLSGVWWIISGALYQGYAFGVPMAHIVERVALVARTLLASFTALGVAASLVGAQAVARKDAALMWALLAAACASAIFAVGYLTADSQVYLIPLLAIFAVWIGPGWAELFNQVRRPALSVIFIGLPLVWGLASNWQAVDLHSDHAARDFLSGIIADAPPNAIVVTAEDRHTFALWVGVLVEKKRPDIVVIDQDMLRFDWYRATLRRNFPTAHVPESKDVNELARQNGNRPVCRPTGQPPPWLACD